MVGQQTRRHKPGILLALVPPVVHEIKENLKHGEALNLFWSEE